MHLLLCVHGMLQALANAKRLYRCEWHGTVAGLVEAEGLVAEASPILCVKEGMHVPAAIELLRARGWKVTYYTALLKGDSWECT